MADYLRWVGADGNMRRMDRPSRQELEVYHAPPTSYYHAGTRPDLLSRPSTTGARAQSASSRYGTSGLSNPASPLRSTFVPTAASLYGRGIRDDWSTANYGSASFKNNYTSPYTPPAATSAAAPLYTSYNYDRRLPSSGLYASGSTSYADRASNSYIPSALRSTAESRYGGAYERPSSNPGGNAGNSSFGYSATGGRHADTNFRPITSITNNESSTSINTSFMTQVARHGIAGLAPPAPSTPTRSTYPVRSHTPLGRYPSAVVHTPMSPTTQQRVSAGLGLLRPTPMAQTRPLLILDLDETLVHASVERRPSGHDFQFLVDMGADSVTVYVKVRPFVEEFLRRVSNMFEVCIFTASVSAYADGVLERIDPHRRFIHHRLYREHCTLTQGNYVKDLSRIGRPMERLCLVDNSPITYAMQPQNGVPINSWFDDPHDTELINLMPMLEHYARSGNFYESARTYGVRP